MRPTTHRFGNSIRFLCGLAFASLLLGALPALGPDAYEYHDHYKSVDVNAEYQLRKGLSLYLSASDVFNAAKVTQRYGSDTPDYAKRYLTDHKGVSLSAGLKGTF